MGRGVHDARYKRLIDALTDARQTARLTQAGLAERLGRRQQFVSKYESGERRLDIVEFIDIARALNVDELALLKRIRSNQN